MNSSKLDLRLYKGDPCFKYVPKYNFDAFIDEV